MGSVEDFEEFFKNYVQKYSSTTSNRIDGLLSVINERKRRTGLNQLQQLSSTTTPNASTTVSPTPSTSKSTSSTSLKMASTSTNGTQVGVAMTGKKISNLGDDSKSNHGKTSGTLEMDTSTQSVKRPVTNAQSTQGPQKKMKTDTQANQNQSSTSVSSQSNSALNSTKTNMTQTINSSRPQPSSLQATIPIPTSVIVSPPKRAKLYVPNSATTSSSGTPVVPSSRSVIAPPSNTAVVPASKLPGVPPSRTSVVATTAGLQSAPAFNIPGALFFPQILPLAPSLSAFQGLHVHPNILSLLGSQTQSFQINLLSSTPTSSTRVISLQNTPNSTPSQITPQILPSSPINPNSPVFRHVTQKAYQVLKQINPPHFTDTFLEQGLFKANLVEHHQLEYYNIAEYIFNSQAHQGFGVDLLSVLKITRPSAAQIPIPSTSSQPIQNPEVTSPTNQLKMMLWHGTRPRNVASILKDGLRCPKSGKQMFGQGVYFADRISKSAQYCNPNVYCAIPNPGEIGYLFLCEVELGNCYNAKNVKQLNKSAPTVVRFDGSLMTFDSLKCTGANIPDREQQREIDGVIWPLGRTIKNTRFPSYTVLYNEYIVYNPKMAKIKYLVKVQFK